MTIKKCKCGSNKFDITESRQYTNAEINDDGTLEIANPKTGGIDRINCSMCGKQYSNEDFERIDFC